MTASPGGVWAAALTPLNSDLSPDLAAMIGHQTWLLGPGGCDGVAVLGTTGEANSFSLAERRRIIDAVAASDVPPEKVLIGTGCCALPDSVELTRAALDAGAAGVLMLPPFYYKAVSDEGLFRAYAQVIEAVAAPDLKVYVYDFPQMTGLAIGVDLLVRLAEAFPGVIVGVKNSSGDWPAMAETAERLPGFGLFAGTERYLLAALRAGGAGCISATANVTGALAAGVFAAWHGPEADRLQDELTGVRTLLEGFPAIPALKQIMADHTGRDGWLHLRPPLVNLSAEQVAALRQAMADAAFQPAPVPVTAG